MHLRKITAALAAFVMLTAVGCSKSDDSGEAAAKSTTTTEASGGGESVTPDDTADDSTDDTADDSTDDTADDGMPDGFPSDLSIDPDDPLGSLDGLLGDMGPCLNASMAWLGVVAAPLALMNPDATEADLEELLTSIEEMQAELPEEIQDDAAVMADAFSELSAVFDPEANTFDLSAMEAMGEVFDSPEYTEASDNIEAWFDENCG